MRPDVLVPVGLWAAAHGAAWAAGFRMRIPWDYYQLLDRDVLRAHPLGGLCYLHSQPPGLNVLLAGVLRCAGVFGTSPEAVAALVFLLFALAAALALFHVLALAAESRAVAGAGVALVLANPGYHVFANLFFYEFLVYASLLLLVAASVRYVARGDGRALLLIVVLTAATSLTRTLFHPVWALGFCMLAVGLRGRVAGRGRHAVLAVVVLTCLLSLWPLKNCVVFGRASFGTMTGYNLARGIPECVRLATVAPAGDGNAIVARARAACGEPALPALTAPAKSDGSPNWNHAGWLLRADELARCGVAWRRAHPLEWLGRTAGQYTMWTRATFEHPYGRQLLGPPTPAYLHYAAWYDAVLFFDLRPFVEWLLPHARLHQYATIRGMPVPYTIFGVVVLPVVVVLLLTLCVRKAHPLRAALALLLLWSTLWPMLAVCLTDGQEGNRMRFSTSGLFLVMLACIWSALRERIATRPVPDARQPTGAAPP